MIQTREDICPYILPDSRIIKHSGSQIHPCGANAWWSIKEADSFIPLDKSAAHGYILMRWPLERHIEVEY